MKANVKSIAKAALVLVLLTILPLVGQRFVPQEFFSALSSQGGLDAKDLINRVALVGLALSVLIAIRGHVEKTSRRFLALSAVWNVFWLFMVFFILGIGHPETLGLTVIGGKSEAAENIVVFDFRLFAVLAAAVVALVIVRSILQFQESKHIKT